MQPVEVVVVSLEAAAMLQLVAHNSSGNLQLIKTNQHRVPLYLEEITKTKLQEGEVYSAEMLLSLRNPLEQEVVFLVEIILNQLHHQP